MKSRTEYLTLHVPTRRGFVNLTPEVERVVRESGVQEGLVLVNAMHITASVFINDDEPGLHHDFGKWLEKLAGGGWRVPLAGCGAAGGARPAGVAVAFDDKRSFCRRRAVVLRHRRLSTP